MAGNTPAWPWAAWPGNELRGDFHTAEDQAKTAHGVWLDGRRQAKDQMKAEAK
jgi:hypothetical protein